MKTKMKAKFKNIKTGVESTVITYINNSTDTISFDFEDVLGDIIETHTISVKGYTQKVKDYIDEFHKDCDNAEYNPFELTLEWLHHVFNKNSKYGNELISIETFIEPKDYYEQY